MFFLAARSLPVVVPTLLSMMAMIRRPPVRCQAVADAMVLSSKTGVGLATTERGRRTSLRCADIQMECLSMDEDYVIINKPVDVRMTGDFEVNVEKLIRHWCPTLSGKELKWVHQLDFATSGVLCVALHREAAARACEAFRERRASKSYLAVVEGIVDAEAFPRRAEEPVGWGEGQDGGGAVATGRKQRPDSVQHVPAHGFFQRKKDRLLRDIQQGETLSAENIAFAASSWGDIKHDKAASAPFTAAARADKMRVIAAAEKAAFNTAQGAPDRGVFRAPGDGPGTFRVDASVSEIPGDFRMRLDEGPGGKGKASRTIVEVLEKGYYRGHAVTKVLLRPHTGRRHQLRLHAVHIGHPILGDVTYANADDTIPRMCLHAQSLRLRLAPREAAGSLAVPAQGGSDAAPAAAKRPRGGLRHKGRPARQAGAGETNGDEVILEIVAPDPFVFVDGELQL